MARYDDPDTPAIVVVGFVSSVLVFAIIVGVQALYVRSESQVSQRRPSTAAADAANLVAEQEARLRRQGWINREQGLVSIPIDRAMRLVVEELRQQQLQQQQLLLQQQQKQQQQQPPRKEFSDEQT